MCEREFKMFHLKKQQALPAQCPRNRETRHFGAAVKRRGEASRVTTR